MGQMISETKWHIYGVLIGQGKNRIEHNFNLKDLINVMIILTWIGQQENLSQGLKF